MKNYSKQRDDLLSILKNSKTHPTAEELEAQGQQQKNV